ncbi:MAG TPA: hypothetical protein GXZ30_10270 [Propionibacterium sp.]|nr:hypothetical protein [Propionibacterium sp.]
MTTMTGSAEEAGLRPARPGPSIAAGRARRLLAGGLMGAHVAALTCVGIFMIRDGLPGLASAGLAAAMVVLFYTVGQWVQVLVADAPAQTVFRASVLSYIARVTALGGLLFVYLGSATGGEGLLALPLIVTAVATVVGWITGEVIVFSKLRIPNFDEPMDRGAEM